MKVTSFPKHVGRLSRKFAEKSGDEFSTVVYSLNKEILETKKFYPVRNILFKVKLMGENHFKIFIDKKPFEEAHSMEEVTSRLINAFDRACIKAGIDESSPKTQTPPDMAAFKNPRS